jgi:hypothetical protein
MRARTHTQRTLIGGCALAAGLALSSCGGSGSDQARVAQRTAARTVAAPVAAVQTPSLRILSPKRGAHTGAVLTVSVLITGASPGSSRQLRYVLDGGLTRHGSAHLTFHELAPGRHHLEAMLNDDRSVRAGSVFTVRTPAPVTPAAVAPTEPAPMQATSQSTASPAPPPTATPKAETPPPPSSTPKPPPTPSGGIPQGNGGDGDSDNNGGPSDGDGNV